MILMTSRSVIITAIMSAWPLYSTYMTGTWDTVSTIRPILRCLDHRRQLKLLIIRIIAFLSGIALSIAHDFFVKLHNLLDRSRALVSCRQWILIAIAV